MVHRFDLAYVDGPTSWSRYQQNVNLPNIDVISLVEQPNLILIDGRRPTVKYLVLDEAFDQFEISLAAKFAWLWGGVVSPSRYHTILRRAIRSTR